MLAVKRNSLTGSDAQPWRLKASFHTFTPATKFWKEENKQGRFEEFWAGADRFKLTYSDEEYSQTVYGTPNGKFVAGGLRMVLGDVRELGEFFEPAVYLHRYAEGHSPEFDPANADAGESACLRTVSDRPKSPKRETLIYRFCFDSSLRLVRFSINGNDDFLILFRKPVFFNGHAIPTEVELRRHGITRMFALLESLEAAEPIDESELQRPADAVPDESDPHAIAMPTNVNVSAGLAAGRLREASPPVYPRDAKVAHVQGTVVLDAEISKEGRIESLRVISGPEMLQQAAQDAARNWIYRPYLINDVPTEMHTTINVIFSLGDDSGKN